MICKFVALDKTTFHVNVGDRPPPIWKVPGEMTDWGVTARIWKVPGEMTDWGVTARIFERKHLAQKRQSWFEYHEVKIAS